MKSTRWLALIAALFVLAFLGSGYLYARSQSADFDAHARAVETFGRARHLDRLLAEQVLQARFGLLNQYDSLTDTELELIDTAAELRARLAEVVGKAAELDRALYAFDQSLEDRRRAVEHFKAENSVLKNSLRYLPTAADEVAGAAHAEITRDVQAVARAALVYNLIGDDSTRAAHDRARAALAGKHAGLPPELTQGVETVLAHARVIAERQPSLDELVKQASNEFVNGRLAAVERLYDARFSRAAGSANRHRQVLYVWSLCLVLAVAVAGLALLRLYAGLERRVEERTTELAKARDALWGEMQLARKIQEALLPSAPSLAGCEVAASMKTAEEVGGDYYDVIQAHGREWILIGDVSGHGVPAGLIMMMCQTAVRTAIERDAAITPDRLLVLVNAVLTENIRQLGEDKYMTITALRRDADGTISFAGAHQDMFVYRADTGEVETFETAGLWLGLKADAEGAFTTRGLRLDAGDVLVLHTDGVTEAVRDGLLFDTDGVRRELRASKGKSARQILDTVLGALDGFELRDDATLLVIRKLEAEAAGEQPAESSGLSLSRST